MLPGILQATCPDIPHSPQTNALLPPSPGQGVGPQSPSYRGLGFLLFISVLSVSRTLLS